MTIINPKSIAGVTSITTASGADNLLTVHTNNTTERIRINNDGDVIVGSGITVSPDGDIFATGVTTATTFSGSGASLTNLPAANITGTLPAISGANLTNLDASDLASGTVPTARLGSGTASSSTFLRGDSTFAAVTSTTINSNTNNYVITGTGTANELQGEENLTWDGSILTVDKGSNNGAVLQCRNDDDTAYSSAAEGHLNSILSLQSTTPGGQNDQSVAIQFNLGLSGQTGSIQEIGAVRTGNGAGALIFRTRNSSSGRVERLRIASDGDVTISDGDLVIGTAGHGIDFSAQTATSASGASTSTEVLDHYEEGTFTPYSPSLTVDYSSGHYIRIGSYVCASIRAKIPSNSNANTFVLDGLPFNCRSYSGTYHNGGYLMYSGGNSYGAAAGVLVYDNSDRLQMYSLQGGNLILTNLDNMQFRIQVHYFV